MVKDLYQEMEALARKFNAGRNTPTLTEDEWHERRTATRLAKEAERVAKYQDRIEYLREQSIRLRGFTI